MEIDYEWRRRGDVPLDHRATSAVVRMWQHIMTTTTEQHLLRCVVRMWQHITTGGILFFQKTSVEKRQYDM
jgi:hypothetical protein